MRSYPTWHSGHPINNSLIVTPHLHVTSGTISDSQVVNGLLNNKADANEPDEVRIVSVIISVWMGVSVCRVSVSGIVWIGVSVCDRQCLDGCQCLSSSVSGWVSMSAIISGCRVSVSVIISACIGVSFCHRQCLDECRCLLSSVPG